MKKVLKEKIWLIAVPLLLALAIIFIGRERMFTVSGYFLSFTAVVLLLVGLGYFVAAIFTAKTGKDQTTLAVPLTSAAAAVISFIVGIILYAADDGFLKGLMGEIVWFFISVPAVITALAEFIIFTVKMMKKK